jgi:hypothetical protein
MILASKRGKQEEIELVVVNTFKVDVFDELLTCIRVR